MPRHAAAVYCPLVKYRLIARRTAYGLGGLLAILLVAALVLPALLDTEAVSAELQQKLSDAIGAEVRWQGFGVRVLPWPRAALRELSIQAKGLNVAANAASVDLALLPLVRGRAEIAAASLRRPVVHIDLTALDDKPAAAATPAAGPPLNPVELHREIVEALRDYVPDAVITVEEGELSLIRREMPPLELRKVTLRAKSDARGLQLEASAASTNWDRLELAARFGYEDLSTDATLEAAGIRPQAWLDWSFSASPIHVGLPNASLKARLRGAAGKPVECDVAIDAGIVDAVGPGKRVRVEGVRIGAHLQAKAEELFIRTDELRLGASVLGAGELRYALKNGSLALATGYELDLAQVLEYARELAPKDAQASLARVSAASGRLKGRLTVASAGSAWTLGVAAENSDAGVQLEDMPGPVVLSGASVSLSPDSVKVERAMLSLLDGSAVASATISDYARGPRVRGSLAKATLGPEVLGWIWKTAALPSSLALKTPIELAIPRFNWAPKAPLDLQASAGFPGGTLLAVDLSWAKGALNLRRAAITDKLSDVSVSLREKGELLEGRYAGKLDSRSLAAILANAAGGAGELKGDLRFTLDTAYRRRTTALGMLKGEKIDLSWLAGKPARIERLDLSASGEAMHIAEATIDWAEQRATVRGDITRTPTGPVIDAQIDSPGIVVDALLPPKKEEKTESKPAKIWPLPVTGQVVLRAGFIQQGTYKVAPVNGSLILEPERAHVDVKEGVLCGISLPFTLEATPKGYSAATQIRVAKQPTEEVMRCLTNEGVLITGTLDAKADLRTQGNARAELLRNLKGTVDLGVRSGLVKKFAIIGNILAMQNVVSLAMQGGPKFSEGGFPFREIKAAGHFEKGRFVLEEGFFHSDAVGIGADGWVSLSDYDCRLTVLVAPLALADAVVRNLPVLGYVVGSSFTSLPVGVSGDIRDPVVIPLGPSAITSSLLGIFNRTIKLPGKALEPLEKKER